MRNARIGDFLTDDQIALVFHLWTQKTSPADFREKVLARVIEPNMAQINRKLGQENHPRYLMYALEHMLTRLDP
jgi:hypothetical protein